MKKEENISLELQIKSIVEKFLEISKDKEIQIISHFDTDGITSATIMIQTLKKLDKKFSVKIVKSLETEFIYKLPKDKLTIFLDLASGDALEIVKELAEQDAQQTLPGRQKGSDGIAPRGRPQQ